MGENSELNPEFDVIYKMYQYQSKKSGFEKSLSPGLKQFIDLQQVYLLQSEALKDNTLMLICEYFRHHRRIKH